LDVPDEDRVMPSSTQTVIIVFFDERAETDRGTFNVVSLRFSSEQHQIP